MGIKKIKRPWGKFEELALNKKCSVKVLTLEPKEELSLQYHKKREELWYFFDKAIVIVENKKINVKSGDIILIKKNQTHRIRALRKSVRVLEVSFGFFDENDEVRIEDKYGRIKKHARE